MFKLSKLGISQKPIFSYALGDVDLTQPDT